MESESDQVSKNAVESTEKQLEKQATRRQIIHAFESSFILLDSYISDPKIQATDEERKDFAFITQARGRTDLRKGRDTYQNKFFGTIGEVYEEGEGIPVEKLIAFLRRQAETTRDPAARKRHLKNAQILEDNSRLFYDIHSSMEPEAMTAREMQEAQQFSGDLDQAKEVLRNRRELWPPPAVHQPPQPKGPELTIGLVAGKQRVEHAEEGGKSQEEMEVLEERAREIARLQMTEDRTKWEGRFSFIRQFIPRLWKSTIGEVATYNKEKNHAIKLLAESGVQMTTLPHSFMEQVDSLARQNIARSRSGIRQRVWGAVRDIFHEATFTEKGLHQERLNIIRQLRQAANRINEPDQQDFLKNHSLGKQFIDILNGDYQASEALAKRVNSEYGDELIHKTIGEKRGQEATRLEGPIADFFKNDIITPLLQEGLAKGAISEGTILQAREKMQEFFFSERFISWYNDPKNQEIRDSLNLSLSYGSDLIPLIQEVILPQVLQAKEHLKSTKDLKNYIKKMVLKVNVGTLEAGQKGVIEEGLLERAASRTITNERVMQLYEQLRASNNAPKLIPDTYLDAAVDRANLVGRLGRLATHQVVMGVAVGAGLYAARAGAGTVGRLVAPIIGGGLVAGAFRAVQERRMFTREHEQHEVETELGYKFPGDARRREQMRSLELHKRDMQSELINPMQQIIKEIDSGTASPERLMELAGLMADTRARFRIMDIRNIGLLAASSPQNYQVEKTNLELTQAKASATLKSYLETHPELGLQDLSVDSLIGELTDVQVTNLERGTGIDAKYQAALGNLTITQAQSIETREQAFRDTRRNRMIMAGTTTAVGVVGGYFLSNFAINRATEFALSHDIPVAGEALRNAGFEQTVRSDKLGNVDLNEAFDHPKGYNLEDPTTHERFTLVVSVDDNNPGRMVDVFDANGQKLGLPMWLAKDGEHTKLIAAGSPDNLPSGLKNYVSEWQNNPTTEHSLKAYMEGLTSGGIKNTPDQVLHQGSVDMNTHDINQSSSLNPDHLSYDEWAATMSRINPATGAVEQGKMSITLKPDALHPEGIRLHGFLRGDGSFDASKDFYIGPQYPSNTDLSSADLQTMTDKLRLEGWTIEQTPTGYHITPPGATEYIGTEKQFNETDFGLPFLVPRRPLEAPEQPKTPKPEDEQKTKDVLEAKQQELSSQPESEERNLELGRLNEQIARLEQAPLIDGETHTSEQIFAGIKGEVDRKHKYFIEEVPDHWINLTEDQLQELESRLPFFINIQQNPDGTISFKTNKRVVPFVYELLHANQRYANGERRTYGDSGLLALAAVSAENPRNQAELYRILGMMIADIHHTNPNLIIEWWRAQVEPAGQISSQLIFVNNDYQSPGKLKPENQRLVYQIGDFNQTWRQRIKELSKAVYDDKLQPHHLRWLEFLSHSINIEKLMEIIKSNQPPPAFPGPTDDAAAQIPTHPPTPEEVAERTQTLKAKTQPVLAPDETAIRTEFLPIGEDITILVNQAVDINPDLNPGYRVRFTNIANELKWGVNPQKYLALLEEAKGTAERMKREYGKGFGTTPIEVLHSHLANQIIDLVDWHLNQLQTTPSL